MFPSSERVTCEPAGVFAVAFVDCGFAVVWGVGEGVGFSVVVGVGLTVEVGAGVLVGVDEGVGEGL